MFQIFNSFPTQLAIYCQLCDKIVLKTNSSFFAHQYFANIPFATPRVFRDDTCSIYVSPFCHAPSRSCCTPKEERKKERNYIHSWTFGGGTQPAITRKCIFSSSSSDQYNYPRSLLQITETEGGKGERGEDCWPGKSGTDLLHILRWYLTILPNFWPQYCWGHI